MQYRPAKAKKNAKSQVPAKPDWRLYDLTKDIGEEHNIAVDHPKVVEKILAILKRDGLL